jgi:hypothetical protein
MKKMMPLSSGVSPEFAFQHALAHLPVELRIFCDRGIEGLQ